MSGIDAESAQRVEWPPHVTTGGLRLVVRTLHAETARQRAAADTCAGDGSTGGAWDHRSAADTFDAMRSAASRLLRLRELAEEPPE